MVEETMVVKLLQQLVVATAFLPVKVVEDHVAHGVPKLPLLLAGLQTRSRGGDRALCPLLQFSKEMRNKILILLAPLPKTFAAMVFDYS